MTAPDHARLVAAAQDYQRRGWSVLPVTHEKKPALKSWKRLQTTPADPTELESWFTAQAFGGAVVGTGIILGDVSGGLVVRDFDEPAAYEAWKAEHSDMAALLPTVRTGRGFHVYARVLGCKTKKLVGGELRAKGSYVVAPPSMHATGIEYTWIVPLPDGEIPLVDVSVFLEVTDADIHKRHNAIWHGSLEVPGTPVHPLSLDSLESPGTYETLGSLEALETHEPLMPLEPLVYGIEIDAFIRGAIQASLPKGVGKRNDAIFDFARRLKAHQELAGFEGLQLMKAMEWWFDAARGIVGTKDWDESWSDFLHAWDKVKTPFGESMQAVLEKAKIATNPKCAAQFSAEPTRLLVRLCRELQHRTGDAPFFLDCRTAANAIETNKDSASSRMRLLVRTGVLKLVKKGHTGRASEFQYLGD